MITETKNRAAGIWEKLASYIWRDFELEVCRSCSSMCPSPVTLLPLLMGYAKFRRKDGGVKTFRRDIRYRFALSTKHAQITHNFFAFASFSPICEMETNFVIEWAPFRKSEYSRKI